MVEVGEDIFDEFYDDETPGIRREICVRIFCAMMRAYRGHYASE